MHDGTWPFPPGKNGLREMGTYEVVNLHLYVLFVLLNNFVMCVYCISDFSEPWVGVGWGGGSVYLPCCTAPLLSPSSLSEADLHPPSLKRDQSWRIKQWHRGTANSSSWWWRRHHFWDIDRKRKYKLSSLSVIILTYLFTHLCSSGNLKSQGPDWT